MVTSRSFSPLKCVYFILLIKFSPPNIISTNSLIYWSNFSITFSFVKTFREISVKWLLFNFFIPQKVPMWTSIKIKSTSKFLSPSCILLMAGFASKKVNYILRGAIQLLLSNGIYALRKWWFKLVCFGNMFAIFTPWFIARTTEALLGFKWKYFGPPQDVL